MEKPEISIIIPIFRVEEALLRRCIESCMNQTKRNIEIILVDDFSNDLSSVICDEYANIDSRVIVIHKNMNEGLSAARNSGVYISSAKWIMFVDGDDWIEADTCELINGVEEYDLVFFGMKRDYGNNSIVFKMQYKDGQQFDEQGCKNLQLDILDYSKRMSTAYCKFVKRQVLLSNHLYHNEEIRCGIEGIEYNLRLFGVISSAIFLGKYKYHYVFNKASITGAPSEQTNQYILTGLRFMKDYIDSIDNDVQLKKQLECRTQRIIFDTAVGSYFNPNYKIKFSERKIKMHTFLSQDVISSIVQCNCYYEKNLLKKVIYDCIVHERYLLIGVFGLIRNKYLLFK